MSEPEWVDITSAVKTAYSIPVSVELLIDAGLMRDPRTGPWPTYVLFPRLEKWTTRLRSVRREVRGRVSHAWFALRWPRVHR